MSIQEIPSIKNIPVEIRLSMDTPSSATQLTIEKVVRVRDTLYVFSKIDRPEVGDCAIGHVSAQMIYDSPDAAPHLKIKHFVSGHNWNWGKSDDISYIQSEQEFDQAVLTAILEKKSF